MYLTVDSLIEINKITTGSNNIALRKVNVKLFGFDKMCIDKEFVENKLYQIIDQFHERKNTSTKFYSTFLNKINSFFDGNGRTCKILFANDSSTHIGGIGKFLPSGLGIGTFFSPRVFWPWRY